ncbi:sugar ABC transporter ATP-binding protein [Delftia lacustris]|uniref:sugar ABC transporter ATP-binding protein n=1 Tax=Delftia lacustris TaxID=558537 RepID=UPI00193C4C76|nr:sugar ABC transporter ATP-binding protein [Delftia lacustris]QRI88410.1 sugar ABC transporter ATP-binding protein [Delftia lacustris]
MPGPTAHSRPGRAMLDAVAPPPMLEARALAKSFGAVQALKGVSFRLRAGTVHTLLGENGAGKSTLLKILAGVHRPDGGQLLVAGAQARLGSPGDAQRHGIAIVHQELSLAPNLSVADNLFAARLPQRAGCVDRRALRRDAAALLARLGMNLDPDAQVAELSLARRQLVEIAKALAQPSRIVIMDEPTSSLSDSEAQILFTLTARLKAEGRAIIYVSHRMDEIMRISDEITVMRDGSSICTLARDETDIGALIALMVGRQMQDIYPPRGPAPDRSTRALLQVRGLGLAGRFEGIDFEVHAGEIVGFFGLVGSGRSDVMDALFGMHRCTGSILMHGRPLRLRSPADAIGHGVAFVTENRKEQGLVLDQSVQHNICMVQVHSGRGGALLTDEAAEQSLARACVQRLKIRVAGLHQPVRQLSGGNQQKIVFAKWLAMRPRLLVLDEPTRGIDVGAKFEIYALIRELAAAGTAVILVSSELPEALAMSDRLLVMRNKRLVQSLDTLHLRQETVMAHATGAGLP